MADNFNHSPMKILNETINLELQTLCDKKFAYYTKEKYMNDYSAIFTD